MKPPDPAKVRIWVSSRLQRLGDWAAPYVTPRNLLIACAAAMVLNVILYASCGLRGCPAADQLTAYQPGGASVLLDHKGKQFAELAPVDREVIELSTLPDYVAKAFIAVEDKRFLTHHGVDWKRVAGAALHNVKSGRVEQGSSTITMQLSRNIFSERLRADDRSLRRKLFEARVARRIEGKFSKPEILELYLNHIHFGGGAYGIQAASRYYFGKPAARLSLAEAALLAALPKAPTSYNPRRYATRARQRRDLVIGLMQQQNLIDAKAADEARGRRLGVSADAPGFRRAPALGAYFAQVVRDQLEQQIGDRIYRQKLRVYTTLDQNAQRAAEEEVRRQLSAVESGFYGQLRGARYSAYDQWTPEGPQYLQGAAVVMESATGAVLALVGGRDFRHSQFNRATSARRQTGSAFKPFVYAAALAEGYVPSQLISDSPFRLVRDGTTWEPRNYDGRFYGPVSMRAALAYSRNIPAVRLAAAVGPDDIATFAHDAGITGKIEDNPMIALGITEATPLELTHAYASFAGMGTRARPRFTQRVEDADGKVIWESETTTEAAIDPAIAFVITDMLADAVDYGTGMGVREAGFHGPAAGKTGTTSDGADTWFAGYTPDLVGTVWLGFDQRAPLPGGASGGSVAAPAWGRLFARIYRTRPMPATWTIPASVVVRAIDPATGLVLAPGCRPTDGQPRRELFLADEEPDPICPEGRSSGKNLVDKVWGAISGLFGGEDEKPKVQPAAAPVVDENLGTSHIRPHRARSDDGDDRRGKGPRKENKGKRARRDRDD